MTDNNIKIDKENTGPQISGSFKSNLINVLSPLIFVIVVTVLMIVLAHIKGS